MWKHHISIAVGAISGLLVALLVISVFVVIFVNNAAQPSDWLGLAGVAIGTFCSALAGAFIAMLPSWTKRWRERASALETIEGARKCLDLIAEEGSPQFRYSINAIEEAAKRLVSCAWVLDDRSLVSSVAFRDFTDGIQPAIDAIDKEHTLSLSYDVCDTALAEEVDACRVLFNIAERAFRGR